MPPDLDEATLDLIAAKIKSGRCILFLGSGVHRPPGDGFPYVHPAEHSPPIGSRLAEILIAQGKLEARFKQLDVTVRPPPPKTS
ncbi:MAG: hypothetical protein M3495_19500 [Pseudomonadota bacterium]|nr:hypothetical protein [Pseudomonadota bacterium]